jgi:RNA polymerase sigma-70 factor (ECF subfamily)
MVVSDPPAPSASPSAEAIAEHLDALYRFALRLVRDPDLAADLVQDTVVRAIEKGAQYRGDGELLSWLRQLLHNLAMDRARRSRREIVVDDVEERWRADDYTVDPAVVASRLEDRETVEDALVRLPFDHRTVVVLHDIEQWRVREIAELQAISLPAAKQRLRRGRMMLVSALASGAERRERLRGVPMRCWDARQHVSDYLDGVLDADTSATVEAHLVNCPTCPPLYAALVDTHQHLATCRDPDSVIPPEIEARLRALRPSFGVGSGKTGN